MALGNNWKPRLGYLPSYQAAAIPFATSSVVVPATGGTPVEVSFPYVSKFITIRNLQPAGSTSIPLHIGFSQNGVTGSVSNNYFTLGNSESFSADFRVKSIFAVSSIDQAGSIEVIAGLTDIDAVELPTNWSGSLGVG